jgi:hypothetical protein|tara:strand:- start:552 stop:764 length:213 start_codon:yes stop_codon:yes gene_type:complete
MRPRPITDIKLDTIKLPNPVSVKDEIIHFDLDEEDVSFKAPKHDEYLTFVKYKVNENDDWMWQLLTPILF